MSLVRARRLRVVVDDLYLGLPIVLYQRGAFGYLPVHDAVAGTDLFVGAGGQRGQFVEHGGVGDERDVGLNIRLPRARRNTHR